MIRILRWWSIRWKVLYHKRALKALERLDKRTKARVEQAIENLLGCLEDGTGCRSLDIKRLYGEWEGFYRLRIGWLRVIYLPVWEERTLKIYNFVFRSKAYK